VAGHRDLNDARQEREVASTSRSGAAPQYRLRRKCFLIDVRRRRDVSGVDSSIAFGVIVQRGQGTYGAAALVLGADGVLNRQAGVILPGA